MRKKKESLCSHKKVVSLIGFLGVCFGIGLISRAFTQTSVDTWYQTLPKLAGTPPDWVFSVVWTLLYACIALAGWLVFLRPASHQRTKAFHVYQGQLFFNGFWSFLFFALQLPLLAFLDTIILSGFIIWNIRVFYRFSKLASWLLVPYLVWVIYAIILNLGILICNR